MYIYGIEKNSTGEPICRAGTEAQTEKGLVDSGGGDGGTNGESGIDLHALSPAK